MVVSSGPGSVASQVGNEAPLCPCWLLARELCGFPEPGGPGVTGEKRSLADSGSSELVDPISMPVTAAPAPSSAAG